MFHKEFAHRCRLLCGDQEIEIAADLLASPVAAAVIADKHVDASSIKGSGAHGKIMKDDVYAALQNPGVAIGQEMFTRAERREKMSNLRKTISRRLVESKNTTAMLTTFNEVDMTRIMDIRKQHKEAFNKAHGVNLGFMSFFAKAFLIIRARGGPAILWNCAGRSGGALHRLRLRCP